jgi:hypothetical protein
MSRSQTFIHLGVSKRKHGDSSSSLEALGPRGGLFDSLTKSGEGLCVAITFSLPSFLPSHALR